MKWLLRRWQSRATEGCESRLNGAPPSVTTRKRSSWKSMISCGPGFRMLLAICFLRITSYLAPKGAISPTALSTTSPLTGTFGTRTGPSTSHCVPCSYGCSCHYFLWCCIIRHRLRQSCQGSRQGTCVSKILAFRMQRRCRILPSG